MKNLISLQLLNRCGTAEVWFIVVNCNVPALCHRDVVYNAGFFSKVLPETLQVNGLITANDSFHEVNNLKEII